MGKLLNNGDALRQFRRNPGFAITAALTPPSESAHQQPSSP